MVHTCSELDRGEMRQADFQTTLAYRLQINVGMTTTTTVGELISKLFAEYENSYHDRKLAALATQVTLDELTHTRRRRVRTTRVSALFRHHSAA